LTSQLLGWYLTNSSTESDREHYLCSTTDNFRVLLNRVKHNRPQEAIDLRAALTGMGVKVFAAEIPDLVAFDKASAQGVPVYKVDDRRAARAWEAFESLGEEIRHG
jgi:chromosome partitioning protein